jgi:hypothetical protein
MPGFEAPNVPKPQDVQGRDLLLRPRFKSPSSQWESNDTADPVQRFSGCSRFEAPNFEPAQCYQHATSHQRNSSETGRTNTGQNAQALE